jgi:hypothetical protein
VLAAEEQNAEHAEDHCWVGCASQPGQDIRRAQSNQPTDHRPGHEHSRGHLEAVSPPVTPDPHPEDHRQGHRKRHPELVQKCWERHHTGYGHEDQHARIHREQHLEEMERKAADAQHKRADHRPVPNRRATDPRALR